MTFFVSPILIMPLASSLMTVQTSFAEPAVNECKAKPDSSAPAGSHWYYRVNRTDKQHCWYLGPEGAKVRSQASGGISSRKGTAARENPPEMTQGMPAPMEPARRTTTEVASAAVAEDVAAPPSDLPKTSDSTTSEPQTISNSSTQERERTNAQEEMPLIWPVLSEPERVGPGDTVRESASWLAFLVGALALLFAGVIFKLARRHAQSSRRGRPRVRRLRARQQWRHPGHIAARPDRVALNSALQTQRDDTLWQRPTSIDPVEATGLRELMRDLQRAAA
jgi:hypothetical protein